MTFLRPKRLEKKHSDAREPSLYRSICTSIISTLLSLVMLVGTTFAWFTDSITSNVFTITAGNVTTTTSYHIGDDGLNDASTWVRLEKDGNMNMFGGATLGSGATQTVYLKLENQGQNTVKYKISLFKVGGEQPGVLVGSDTIEEKTDIATQANEAPIVETKYLSEMMRFEYVVTEDVDTFLLATQSGEGTSGNNSVQLSESEAKPFEITVPGKTTGKTTKYVKLTLKLDDYVGVWQSLPSISLKLKIVITQPGDNDPVTLEDEKTTQQSNDTENVTEPVENTEQPIVTVGVDMTTEIETPVQPAAQPQQPAVEETESGDANTAGSTENADDTTPAGAADDGGNADTSNGAADVSDSPVDTAAVEPSAEDDAPAADPAA